MVKLVLTDVDGTLVPEGTADFPRELIEIVERIKARGVSFGVASGRSFHSCHGLFAPVADGMSFFCENGCLVLDSDGRMIDGTPIPRETVLTLFRLIDNYKGANICMGCESFSYIVQKSDGFLSLMRDTKGTVVKEIKSEDEITETVYKISVFCGDGDSSDFVSYMERNWEKSCHMDESAVGWVDFSVGDKAEGIRNALRRMNISLKDVVYFGDSYNDLDVLRMVGHPFLMECGAEGLKEEFRRRLSKSVAKTLNEMLERGEI